MVMDKVQSDKAAEEFSKDFENLLDRVLDADSEVIMKSLLMITSQILQTIMLINFRAHGYLTNVEQREILDSIIHNLLKKTYYMSLGQVNEVHPEWFEKKKREIIIN